MPETAKVTKRHVCVGAHVEAEFPLHYTDYNTFDGGTWRARTPEEMGKLLAKLCDEFHTFIRDHRSQDAVRLSVVKDHQDQCSACGHEWDPTMENSITYCGYCGEEVSDA